MTWQEAVSYIKTPEGVKDYIGWLKSKKLWDGGHNIFSFRRIHQGAPIDCTEAAIAAAALLNDNSYQPLVLVLAEKQKLSGFTAHAVFLYKQENKFGSIGINDTDNKFPAYATVDELARALSIDYKAGGYNLVRYTIVNLAENGLDFIVGSENMQKDFVFGNKIPE